MVLIVNEIVCNKVKVKLDSFKRRITRLCYKNEVNEEEKTFIGHGHQNSLLCDVLLWVFYFHTCNSNGNSCE